MVIGIQSRAHGLLLFEHPYHLSQLLCLLHRPVVLILRDSSAVQHLLDLHLWIAFERLPELVESAYKIALIVVKLME